MGFIFQRKANCMRTISPQRIFSIVGIVVLGCFPLYTIIVENLHLLVFWFVGLLVLGCFMTLQARSFRAAIEVGFGVGCLSSALVVGVLVYGIITSPLLHALIFTPTTTPRLAGVSGWLPFFYVILIIFILIIFSFMAVVVALICSSIGGLVGMVVSRLIYNVSSPFDRG